MVGPSEVLPVLLFNLWYRFPYLGSGLCCDHLLSYKLSMSIFFNLFQGKRLNLTERWNLPLKQVFFTFVYSRYEPAKALCEQNRFTYQVSHHFL